MSLPNQHLLKKEGDHIHFGRMLMDLPEKQALNMAVHIVLLCGKEKFDELYAQAIDPEPPKK